MLIETNAGHTDPVIEDPTLNRAMSQIERRVLPILVAAWFIAYIDRFNVGFAALHMNAELGLSPRAFGLGAGLFFLAYAVCELPSNLILARVGPRKWLGRIMISWGMITVLTAFVAGERSFYILRFLLGVAEAGCFPGMVYYLGLILPLRRRTRALATLGAATQAAALVGGPIAGAILGFGALGGLASWRWLFIIEGLPAVALGCWVLRALPDSYEDVASLSSDERASLRAALDASARHSPTSVFAAVQSVARNYRYAAWAFVFFCYNLGSSSLKIWQPTVLKTLSDGHVSDLAIGALTSLPAAVGLCAILFIGYSATKRDERAWHTAIPLVIGGLGLAGVAASTTLIASIASASVAFMAVACQPPLFATVSATATGPKQAAAIAYVNSLAMTGSFVGPYVVGAVITAMDSPRAAYFLFSVLWITAASVAVSKFLVSSPSISPSGAGVALH